MFAIGPWRKYGDSWPATDQGPPKKSVLLWLENYIRKSLHTKQNIWIPDWKFLKHLHQNVLLLPTDALPKYVWHGWGSPTFVLPYNPTGVFFMSWPGKKKCYAANPFLSRWEGRAAGVNLGQLW